MRPAGREAFARRIERKSGIYAYERTDDADFTPAQRREFRAHAAAWAFHTAQPPYYRKRMLHWVISAKKDETRAKRLATLIAASAKGQRL